MMKITDILKNLKELHHLVILRISDSLMRPAAYSFLLAYVFLLEIALSEVFLYKLVFENQKYSAFEALVAQPILWLEAGGWAFVVVFLIGVIKWTWLRRLLTNCSVVRTHVVDAGRVSFAMGLRYRLQSGNE